MSAFVQKVALDFGESSFRLYVKETGEYIEESQDVFFQKFLTDQVKPFSRSQKKRRFQDMFLHGIIQDTDLLSAYLQTILSHAGVGKFLFSRIELLIAVPTRTPASTKFIWLQLCDKIGISKVTFVSTAVAAAVGAGFAFPIPTVAMLINLGYSESEVSAVSLNQCLFSISLPINTRALRAQIESKLHAALNHQLTPTEWENVQPQIGALLIQPRADRKGTADTGASSMERLVHEEIQDQGRALLSEIQIALEKLSVEELSLCSSQGIVLTGGLARQENIAQFLSRKLAIPVYSSGEPDMAVIRGEASLLETLEEEDSR